MVKERRNSLPQVDPLSLSFALQFPPALAFWLRENPVGSGGIQLAGDKGLKTTQNVASGVAGTFIPVLWLGMDFQGTADTEITALQSRQQYLSMMADQKRCAAEPEPLPPPARAKRAAKPRVAAAAPQTEEPSADAAAKQKGRGQPARFLFRPG
jgi:hypothetical protein